MAAANARAGELRGIGSTHRQKGGPLLVSLEVGGLSMKELARRVMHGIQEDDCFGRAAQLAYDFLFALLPSFLFLTTLLGNLPIPQLLDRMMEVLAQVQPGDALQLI
jgi:membrane protein